MSSDNLNDRIYMILQRRDNPSTMSYYINRLAECNEALEKINNRDDVFRIAMLDSTIAEYAPMLDLFERITKHIEEIKRHRRLAISEAESKAAGRELYGIPYEDRKPKA